MRCLRAKTLEKEKQFGWVYNHDEDDENSNAMEYDQDMNDAQERLRAGKIIIENVKGGDTGTQYKLALVEQVPPPPTIADVPAT